MLPWPLPHGKPRARFMLCSATLEHCILVTVVGLQAELCGNVSVTWCKGSVLGGPVGHLDDDTMLPMHSVAPNRKPINEALMPNHVVMPILSAATKCLITGKQ